MTVTQYMIIKYPYYVQNIYFATMIWLNKGDVIMINSKTRRVWFFFLFYWTKDLYSRCSTIQILDWTNRIIFTRSGNCTKEFLDDLKWYLRTKNTAFFVIYIRFLNVINCIQVIFWRLKIPIYWFSKCWNSKWTNFICLNFE